MFIITINRERETIRCTRAWFLLNISIILLFLCINSECSKDRSIVEEDEIGSYSEAVSKNNINNKYIQHEKSSNSEVEEEGYSEAETTSNANVHANHYGYSREYNEILSDIKKALKNYKPVEASSKDCSSIYDDTIDADLQPFIAAGITEESLLRARSKGTRYQIVSGKVYRDDYCLFPARCSGVEHFLLSVASELPDLEMVLNTRDWPQVSRYHDGSAVPVFSFSKSNEFFDIMYPAWSFWEGGPAISLYPRGLGRWDQHRKSLIAASKNLPWEMKKSKAFFRGSRTSGERDALVLLSRAHGDLVDAAYTKNQAWKSDEDTLDAPPAKEIALEEHCAYKFLFNFRGVAASFRLKHLFLCNSLVFHVGDEWTEFFYSKLVPWIHYVPVRKDAPVGKLKSLVGFFRDHDDIAKEIAERGRDFIVKHLRMKDVECYWKNLLKRYAELLTFDVKRDPKLTEILPKKR